MRKETTIRMQCLLKEIVGHVGKCCYVVEEEMDTTLCLCAKCEIVYQQLASVA